MGAQERRRDRNVRLDLSHLLPPPPSTRGPRWWRRLRAWLDRPVNGAVVEPLDPDTLVELTRVSLRVDAETVVRELTLWGIHAELYAADAEGAAPHYALAQGHRIMVRAGDVDRSLEALTGSGT